MRRPPRPPKNTPPAEWSRRSLVEWLGKATVLALGADLIAACGGGTDGQAVPGLGGAGGQGGGAGGGGAAGSGGQGGSGGGQAAACGPEAQLQFAPGDESHPLFGQWPVNTVDPQDLTQVLASWTFTVDGMVEQPLELTFTELLQLERRDQVSDFKCVLGWKVPDVPWNGVHIETLLGLATPLPAATHVTFHCIGGTYSESLSLPDARAATTLLAYGIDCHTLPLPHGFPLRLVAAGKYGYKSAKYLSRIELTDHPVDGYWEQVGYDYDADIPG